MVQYKCHINILRFLNTNRHHLKDEFISKHGLYFFLFVNCEFLFYPIIMGLEAGTPFAIRFSNHLFKNCRVFRDLVYAEDSPAAAAERFSRINKTRMLWETLDINRKTVGQLSLEQLDALCNYSVTFMRKLNRVIQAECTNYIDACLSRISRLQQHAVRNLPVHRQLIALASRVPQGERNLVGHFYESAE